MKELLLKYARYNLWANKLYINLLAKLDDNQVHMQMVSSFPTIRQTVLHMWAAEDIWVQRLQLAENPIWKQNTYEGSYKDMLKGWGEASAWLAQFTEKQFSDASFKHVVQYNNLKKEPVKLEVGLALMHAFNHATYHRGQLVTMMRQAGVQQVPATDFFLFAQK